MKKTKKGMTYKVLFGMIFLIIAAAAIFTFLRLYPWKENIDKTVCHQSVILRASANAKIIEFKGIVPLKCKTEEVCLVSGGFFSSSEGCPSLGQDYKKQKISSKKDVLDFISDEIYDWHSTMGEGKINFMPHTTFNEIYCFVGDVISFDEETKKVIEEENGISYMDLYEHMANKKNPDGVSYLSFIYGMNNVEEIQKYYDEYNDWTGESENKISMDASLDLTKDYAIIGEMFEYGRVPSYLSTAVVLVSGTALTIAAVFTYGATLPAAVAIFGIGMKITTVATAYNLWFASPNPDEGFVYIKPSLREFDKETLESLKCTDFANIA